MPPNKLYSVLRLVWGLGFWVVLLLGPLPALTMKGPVRLYRNHEEWNLMWWHWLVLALIILFFALGKGYRGFQSAFSPMLVKRAYHFSSTAAPTIKFTAAISVNQGLALFLAPLLSSGHICATRKRLIHSWALIIFVPSIIALVSCIPEDMPWGSFIYIGVVIALAWGWMFIIIWWFKVGLLDIWPDWVPNEYPSYLTVKMPENMLITADEISTSNGTMVNDAIHEVKSIHFNGNNQTEVKVNEALEG